MAKNNLTVNSHKFLSQHFHIANELERFFENSENGKNPSHTYITLITPMFFTVISMNDSFLRFTLNEILIEKLRKITQYYNDTALLLDEIYVKCNTEIKGEKHSYLINEAEKIYKKTVSELREAAATNLIEKLHIKQLMIVFKAIRNLTLLKMEFEDCNPLTPLLCDIDITTKTFIKEMERAFKN